MIAVVEPERFGLPRVPSIRVACGRCGASCWLSRRADRAAIEGFLCIICAMAVVKPGDTIEPGAWVVADLAEALE